MDITPGEGRMAIQFIEDDTPDPDSDVVLAVVIGIGKEVTNVKKGDTVLVDKEAKDYAIKVDDSTYITSAWSAVATVSDD